ncbi:MAG: glycosyltransferase [Bacteroidetes bacterium]|nr:glycosyltransferase [Bacteroidota bacterium]
MTFSIVIPTCNGSRFIEAALLSALNQTRKADQVLVSDDNSSDDTLEICRKYGESISIFTNESGPSGFVNGWLKAIGHADGDFITILHQDDLISPDYLFHVENALLQYPDVCHVYSRSEKISEFFDRLQLKPTPEVKAVLYTGKQYAKNYINGIYKSEYIHRCPGVTTSRKLLLESCTYREEAGHIADDDFFFRIGNYTKVIGIDTILAYYREHASSTTSRQENLSFILAGNWVFQMEEYHGKKNPLLDEEDMGRIAISAVRDLTTTLETALRNKDDMLLAEMLILRGRIFRCIHQSPGQITESLNKKALWWLIDRKMKRSAILYSRFIYQLKRILRDG